MTTNESPERQRRISAHDVLDDACELMDSALAANPVDASESWALRLQEAARSLGEAIEMHRDIAEAEDGTMNELMQLRPALAERLERQREEHVELSARAHDLRRELEEALAFDHLDTEFLHLAATVLREGVRLHALRGVDLLFEAYDREEGGESG